MFCFLNWSFHGERELGEQITINLCVFVGGSGHYVRSYGTYHLQPEGPGQVPIRFQPQELGEPVVFILAF